MRYSLLFFLLPIAWIEACTGFQLVSQDNAQVYCRSLEYLSQTFSVSDDTDKATSLQN